MSDITLRAALKTRLLALGAGIGRVHDYERWAAEPAKFLTQFQDATTRKVFGWEITRTGCRIERVTMSRHKMIHQYVLRGYYGLSDEAGTEKTFGTLVDMIAIDLTRTPIDDTNKGMLPQIQIEARMFGGILCHVAEIKIQLEEIISPAEDEDADDFLRVGLLYYLQDPADDGVVDATDIVELE